MRRRALLTIWMLAGSAAAMHAACATDTTIEPQHPLIIVTFSNQPSQAVSHAGTTARRYAGTGYQVARRAHRQAAQVAAAYSLREVANWPIRALSVHCVVFALPDNRPLKPMLDALSRDPRVVLAQPLQQFHTLTQDGPAPYNDPLYDLQTNLATLGIAQAHARSQGSGVRIALIDTGVDAQHPDLRARIAANRSFVPRRPNSPDSYRHGTAMAGLIAATANNKVGIVGIAPLATLEVFAACWQLQPDADGAACNTFTLAQALSAALDAGIPLVNLSIAGPADPLLSALITVGLKRGVIFVGSATNEPDSFPTGIAGVIGVAGSEHEGGGTGLTAPAVHVLTLRPRGQYDFESGTSVAAAEVTGVIALLLGTDRHLTARSVEALLKQTAASAAPAAPSRTGLPLPLAASESRGETARSAVTATLPEASPQTVARTVVDVNAALARIDELKANRLAAHTRQ